VFAIVLPLLNTTLIALAATTADGIQRAQFRGVAKDLSRWCMADVFAATLALVLFVTPFNGLLVGQLRWGFYCLAGYVLLSIAANRVQE
jgi:uncharacterized paraquat-inducible protein A